MKKLLLLPLILFGLIGCMAMEPTDDVEAPILYLVGEEETYIEMHEEYVDIGAYANDNVDDYVEVIITDTVDTTTSGTYYVYYNASDNNGNEAETIYRTVHVTKQAPSITIELDYTTKNSIRVVHTLSDRDNAMVRIDIAIYINGEDTPQEIKQLTTPHGIEFYNLLPSVDYQIKAFLCYDLQDHNEQQTTTSNTIEAGVFKRLNEVHRSVISDSDHFDVLKDIIYLPYRYEDTDSVNDILLRLAAIDIELLRGLRTAHVDIILTNRHITDIKEYIDLRGVTPRGWEDTGLTWEDIPGLGGNPVVIKIGESDPGDSHNSINLELHEVAHAINLFLLDQLSESTEFAVIHAAEKYSMFGEYPYYDYKEEYFAECFAYYYYSAESNAALLEKAPLTHALIAGLSIDYFEE